MVGCKILNPNNPVWENFFVFYKFLPNTKFINNIWKINFLMSDSYIIDV